MRNLKQLPTRCKARRKNGQPCKNPPITGGAVCRMHGGGAPQVKRSARQRVLEAAEDAASLLVRLMADETVDLRVRVNVAQDFLDRANVTGKTAVEVEVKRYEHMLGAAVEDGGVLTVVSEDVLESGDIQDAQVVDPEATEDSTRRDIARGWLREHDMLAVPGTPTRGRRGSRA